MLLKNWNNMSFYSFYNKINKKIDSTGIAPKEEDLMEFYYVQKNPKTNQTIVYSNNIKSKKYNISFTII